MNWQEAKLVGASLILATAIGAEAPMVANARTFSSSGVHRLSRSVPDDISKRGLIAYTSHGRTYHSSLLGEKRVPTQISRSFAEAVDSRETNDINQVRLAHQLPKLSPNPKLVNLAEVRAKQCNHHFGHYNHRHQVIVWRDARGMMMDKSKGDTRHTFGENISKSGRLVKCQENHRQASYYFMHAGDLADTNVYDLMNNDNADHNQHRHNILNPRYHDFGVGTYYNRKTRALYIVTVFSMHNPE